MVSHGDTDSDASDDTRMHGIEFGELKAELDVHEYPTTDEELLAEYGDSELGLPDGSQTLEEILGKRRSESDGEEAIRFESPEDVQESIYNMVGSEAVGRDDYSDRGGSLERAVEDEPEQKDEEV